MAEIDEDELNELWDYSLWELISTGLKKLIWGICQRLRHPKRFFIKPLSEEQIQIMREEAIAVAKEKAAELLGGSPDDYIIRGINNG